MKAATVFRKVFASCIAMTVAVLIAASSPAFATSGLPSSPVDLSATGQDAYGPQVSVDSTGLATAVWSRYDGSTYIIQSSTSQSGGTWSAPVDLSAAGQDAEASQVSVDSTGLATAVWYRYDGSRYIIQSSTSQSGGTWSSPVDLSATGLSAFEPQVSVDSSGLATAVWFRSDGSNTIIQSSTSLSGGTWSTPVDLSATGQSARNPQVSVDSTGLATAVWIRFDGGNDIIQSSTSQSGAAWSAPVDLSATGQSAYDPQVSVDSTGLAAAVWFRFDGGNTIIQFSTSQSGGPWSAPVDLSATGQSAYDPQVSIDSTGLAAAVWFRSDGSNTIIQFSTSQSGGPWSAPVDLSATGLSAFDPQVSVDSTGLATVVWYRYDGSNDIIQFSTSQSGGTWSAPVDLSATGQDASTPQVSVDSSGLATAVWFRWDGSNYIVQSATIFNPIAPIPTPIPTPVTTPELAKTGINLNASELLAVGAAALFLLGVGGTLLTRRTKNST